MRGTFNHEFFGIPFIHHYGLRHCGRSMGRPPFGKPERIGFCDSCHHRGPRPGDERPGPFRHGMHQEHGPHGPHRHDHHGPSKHRCHGPSEGWHGSLEHGHHRGPPMRHCHGPLHDHHHGHRGDHHGHPCQGHEFHGPSLRGRHQMPGEFHGHRCRSASPNNRRAECGNNPGPLEGHAPRRSSPGPRRSSPGPSIPCPWMRHRCTGDSYKRCCSERPWEEFENGPGFGHHGGCRRGRRPGPYERPLSPPRSCKRCENEPCCSGDKENGGKESEPVEKDKDRNETILIERVTMENVKESRPRSI